MILVVCGGILFALLSAILFLLLRKSKVEAERKRLIDLREQMQEELEKVQRYYCLDWMMRKHRHALKEIERITNCLNNSKDMGDIV